MNKLVDSSKRASKKQQEMYDFIESFINEHGYGPSYREIMEELDYKSVSTVSVHVDGLIKKGYLKKLATTARSLAIADSNEDDPEKLQKIQEHKKWFVKEAFSRSSKINERSNQKEIAESETLLEAIKVLGLQDLYLKISESSLPIKVDKKGEKNG